MKTNPSIDTIASLTPDEAQWIQHHYLKLARVNTKKYPRDQARDIVQFYADTGIPPDNATLDEIFSIGCGIEDHFAGLRGKKAEPDAKRTCNRNYQEIVDTFKRETGNGHPVYLIRKVISQEEALRFFDRYSPFERTVRDRDSDSLRTILILREEL